METVKNFIVKNYKTILAGLVGLFLLYWVIFILTPKNTMLKEDRKQIIEITENQVTHFAGNMLQVFDINEKPHLIMSEQAYNCLKTEQVKSLEKYNPILPISIPTIEALGGGSTRCMMAEIYLSPA